MTRKSTYCINNCFVFASNYKITAYMQRSLFRWTWTEHGCRWWHVIGCLTGNKNVSGPLEWCRIRASDCSCFLVDSVKFESRVWMEQKARVLTGCWQFVLLCLVVLKADDPSGADWWVSRWNRPKFEGFNFVVPTHFSADRIFISAILTLTSRNTQDASILVVSDFLLRAYLFYCI